MKNQQIIYTMTKLNNIIKSTLKLQVGWVALTMHVDDLETLVNRQQPNRNNDGNEGKTDRNHNNGRGNFEHIEDIENEQYHDDITCKFKVDVPAFGGTYDPRRFRDWLRLWKTFLIGMDVQG